MSARANAGPRARTEVIHIEAADVPTISLGLLKCVPLEKNPLLPPMLLLHGATLGASVFDLPLAGFSLMAEMARGGRSVYAVDIRGFGHSRIGPLVDAATLHDPFPTLAESVADLGAAVAAVRARERVVAVDLVGFSWGCIAGVRYAAQFPQHIARLALYAPFYGERNSAWLDRIADPIDPTRLRGDFGAYRSVGLSDLTIRWNDEIGDHDIAAYRDPGVLECVFETLCKLDRQVLADGKPAFRCPTGPLADLVNVFNGRRLYDAYRLTMPTFLVRGRDDITSTDSDAKSLLRALHSAVKSYTVIDDASHFLLLEKKRTALYRALEAFFEPLKEPVRSVQEDVV